MTVRQHVDGPTWIPDAISVDAGHVPAPRPAHVVLECGVADEPTPGAEEPTRLPVQSRTRPWSTRRTILSGAVIAGTTGAVIGPFLAGEGFAPPAAVFYGGLAGLTLGAVVGLTSTLLAVAAARVARSTGAAGVTTQRFAFTAVGTLIAVLLAYWTLPPLGHLRRSGLTLALGLTAVAGGRYLSRRWTQTPG